MRIRQPPHDNYGINVIPMIDTMMFLLVFFLMATRFADLERDARVKPATSRNVRPITAMPRELIVNVTETGGFVVSGRPVTLNELDALLVQAMARDPEQAVVVRGDRQSVLQHAVNVLDVCEKRGVVKTFLTTTHEGP